MSQDKNVQNVFTARHPFSILLTMQCVTSKYISSEISKSEEGGRRGVLLPGKERCGTRAVSPANDGSLWVSEQLSQCFDRPLLKLFFKRGTKFMLVSVLCVEKCYQNEIQKGGAGTKKSKLYFRVWQVHLANKCRQVGQVIAVLEQLMTNGKQLGNELRRSVGSPDRTGGQVSNDHRSFNFSIQMCSLGS